MKHENLQRLNAGQQGAIVSLNQWSLCRLCSVLALAGMISVGAGFVEPARAINLTLTHQVTETTAPSVSAVFNIESNLAAQPASNTQFPQPAANKLRQDLSQRTGIPPGKLRVVEAARKNWSDGCLGLPKPDELCTQATVDGWRVVLSDGNRRWVYRTDRRGFNFRLEPPSRPTSPPRGDGSIQPTPISAGELPPAVDAKTVFRAIASGGFIGRTYETTLTRDGRVTRRLINPNGTPGKPEVRRISQQQVWQFQQLLRQHHLERFNRLNYPPVQGSADFTTITLSSRSSTVRYADTIQNQLPSSLQAIIQGWNQITASN
ncbi:hypothetical protein K9N68_19275 [Kovacikia minuta CCNUW1]|uniref:hypothetical protein n=1 Tax=Kovacikia minuta TaxID=2931930 RepID=UPI001CCA2119|nr:hypothetical protein [Kovacikia minuta]UBF23889.1 hypothetical protein K9N68_19275 [Kovacikia minuta CCNUW1]